MDIKKSERIFYERLGNIDFVIDGIDIYSIIRESFLELEITSISGQETSGIVFSSHASIHSYKCNLTHHSKVHR